MEKQTFKVEITETLQRTIEVEAEDLDDAISKAKEKYYNEEVVLDSEDYIDTEFTIVDEENGGDPEKRTDVSELPTEEDFYNPGLDDEDEIEEYARHKLEEIYYGYKVISFTFEFDVSRIYVTEIEWNTNE